MSAPESATLIDVVDVRDHPVGTSPRGRVLQEGENFRTVHVFVFDRAGRLLLQRLAPSRERHPKRWGSSVAAYLFAGEDYPHGAKRRMREELGISPPTAYVGKLWMNDERSVKFVALFQAESDRVRNAEPSHLSDLEFRSLDWIRERLEREPESFTPTFMGLFEKFGDSLA